MPRVSRVLSHLSEEAKKGVITTVTQIQRAIEAQIDQTVHPTTIYRLLERHQWRKVIPVLLLITPNIAQLPLLSLRSKIFSHHP